MTHRRISLWITTVALAAVATGVVVARQGPPPGAGPGQGPAVGGPGRQAPMRGVQLTDEQRTRVEALMKEQRDRAHASRDQVQKLREQLHTELFADKLDEAKIKQLRGEIAKAQQEMTSARIDHQAKISQVLTPEQRKQVREARSPAARMFGRGAFGPGAGQGFGRGFGPGMGNRAGRGMRRGFGGPAGPVGPGRGFGPRWWRQDEDEPK